MSQAQREDPTCREVLNWFGDNLTPARPPTLRPEETVGELKWFSNRGDRLRLVKYLDGTTLLAILAETRQGEKAENEKNEKTQVIVPISQRIAVMSMAHSKAHSLGGNQNSRICCKQFCVGKNEGRCQKICTPMCHLPGEARGKLET